MKKLSRKTWWLISGLAVIGALAALSVPASRTTLYGLLRGEARFRHLPTSYWASELRQAYTAEVARVRGQPSTWERLQLAFGWKQATRLRKLPPLRDVTLRPAGMPDGPFGDPVPSRRTHFFGRDPTAIAVLTELLDNSDPVVRADAAQTLAQIGPVPARTVQALARALADDDWDVRLNAVWALGMIGSPARTALPALRTAADDPNEVVRFAAELAVWRIDPRERLIRAPDRG